MRLMSRSGWATPEEEGRDQGERAGDHSLCASSGGIPAVNGLEEACAGLAVTVL
jgi:hypothetical protein